MSNLKPQKMIEKPPPLFIVYVVLLVHVLICSFSFPAWEAMTRQEMKHSERDEAKEP